MQILPTFSQHLKLFRVDLKLSNEYFRSFVAQKLVLVAQIEIWWKFWKIDFWMKNSIFDRKSDFSIRSCIGPQERVFIAERRATRRWKALGSYFRVISTYKYMHTPGTSYAHIRHTQNQEFHIFWNFRNFVKNVWCAWCVHRMCLVCTYTCKCL